MHFRLFKNNVDSFGNSYGCHENYLVSRDLDLEVAADLLATFLVTRQIVCGSGRLHRGEFTISQRADHLHDQLSALTTRARPLLNTRDEPLADATRFRRLHVLAGDSNLLEPSAWLKVGTLAAVLELLDTPDGPDRRLAGLRLADPASALKLVARDPGVRLELADGRHLSAIELQRAHLELAAGARRTGPGRAVVAGAGRAGRRRPRSGRLRGGVGREAPAARRLPRQVPPWPADDPKLAQLDLAFHELGGLFGLLEAGGAVTRMTDPAEVEVALLRPPSGTRAEARSAFLAAAAEQRTRPHRRLADLHRPRPARPRRAAGRPQRGAGRPARSDVRGTRRPGGRDGLRAPGADDRRVPSASAVSRDTVTRGTARFGILSRCPTPA